MFGTAIPWSCLTMRTRRTTPPTAQGHVIPAAQGLGGTATDCTLCGAGVPEPVSILRNGLQFECIGCAACIDACDSVMDKMG